MGSLLSVNAFSAGSIGGLDSIGNIPLGGLTEPPPSSEPVSGEASLFTATLSNISVTDGKNVVLSIRLGDGQKFVKADSRCAVDTGNGKARCFLKSVPSGLTELGFKAEAPQGEEVIATAEFSADNDTEFRDNTAVLRSAVNGAESTNNASDGGGSVGWLSLSGLAALRRRKYFEIREN